MCPIQRDIYRLDPGQLGTFILKHTNSLRQKCSKNPCHTMKKQVKSIQKLVIYHLENTVYFDLA